MAQPKVTRQSAEKRIRNFNEVSLGYSKKVVSEESRRCPQCADTVCIDGCPLGVNVPGFIRLLREGDVPGAYHKIKEKNCLPSICGRICSSPCEIACILNEENATIGIRALERYASDFGKSWSFKKEVTVNSGKKVAIVGSGPCGLSAAAELAKKGYQPTIFESFNKPGGVLRYGVPEFRLPKKILDGDINDIKTLGVEIKTNYFVGQTISLEDLLSGGFSAVLLATGAAIPKFMDIKGANLGGVFYGEEFLMRSNLIKTTIFSRQIPAFGIGKRIAVIGSGNTALDCARSALRFGRDVTLMFRRTEEDMRVRNIEREFAKEEGINFEPLVRPVEIMSDQKGFVRGLKCVRMDYADSDSTGEWKLTKVPNSEFVLDVDTVVVAIGHRPNSIIAGSIDGLKVDKDGSITADAKTSMTSVESVFAAGNAVTNAGPLVQAMLAGKTAAENIDNYLSDQ